MKYTILFNILLIIGAVLAATEFEEDSGEQITSTTAGAPVNDKESQKEDGNDDDSTEVKDNKKPVNFFYGQQSHSVFNSNGNGIVVSSRFDSNGNEEKYISIGSPKIRIDGDHFTCTNLSCPESTFKCVVTSEALADDRNSMKTKAECLDKEGKVLEDTEYTEKNPHPEAEPPFSRIATVDRNGGIDVEDSTGRNTFNVKKLTKEEQEKVNKELQENQQRINEMFAYQQRLFQQQMDELNRQLSATFGNPNFPFGNYNPFRQNIGFSSFPFGNNWPFGGSFGNSFGYQNSFPFGNNNPFRDNVNFDSIDIDRPSNTFYVETSNPTNINNPHNPASINPYAPIRPTKEIESAFDNSNESDNEIFSDPNNRIMVNNMNNRNNRYNERYRYAHGY